MLNLLGILTLKKGGGGFKPNQQISVRGAIWLSYLCCRPLVDMDRTAHRSTCKAGLGVSTD